MEVSLKSSVGRAFAASFDPVTVARLLDLAVVDAEQRKLRTLSGAIELNLRQGEPTEETAAALQEFQRELLDVGTVDVYAPSVLGAFAEFLAEFKLLQTGSGSERACMESFYSLCELLQG